MFERFRGKEPDQPDERVVDRTHERELERPTGAGDDDPERTRVLEEDRRPAAGAGAVAAEGTPRERAAEVRARQREEFGGLNLGAAFFGWLVAVGVAVLLTALLGAAGAAVGLTTDPTRGDAVRNASELGAAGAIALLVVLFVAYYCGGYVAGRMSRFNGVKQGFGVWLIALLVTALLAALGAIAGTEYNVLTQLNLPSIPVGSTELAGGGLIALLVILVVTLLAAVIGGKVGTLYHKKVDRAGFAA